jgi:hypothetical protein
LTCLLGNTKFLEHFVEYLGIPIVELVINGSCSKVIVCKSIHEGDWQVRKEVSHT